MPSSALQKFERNMLVDVDRIIESHGQLNHDGLGRRGLGHITRSGVLMLCAAWELYLEELLVESVRTLIRRADIPTQLPQHVQKEISKTVRESKHELKPLELAGDGWKTVYDNHTTQTIQGLNTPKSTNIDPLFKRFVGIENLSNSWSIGEEALNAFVTARGDIAHRGRNAGYITIINLHEYRAQILRCVIDTDNAMADFIQRKSIGGSPWRRRAI
ncbi:HEPN domain-containing protein [Pseudomonas sp. FIP_A4]|uniref:HEPN domain-containing protein n=1 Tax=Pseudomonas sp. FIP_A4 TaxID=3070684 RepID=UPI002FCF9A6B